MKSTQVLHHVGANIIDHVPPRDVANRLLAAYLCTFESIFRIVHVPTFQWEYNSYWTNPAVASRNFVVQMLLVLAIGATFIPDEYECITLRHKATSWISNAQVYLNVLPEKARLNVSGLQTQCLLLLARVVNGTGGDTVSSVAASLLRTAMNLGLHIDPSHFQHVSVLEGEISRRLWYTVLELDVQSSMDAGCIPMLSSRDYDTQLPSNIDDEQLDENCFVLPKQRSTDHYTRSLPQIMLARSLALRSDIARHVNDFREGPTFDETLTLATQLVPHCLFNSRSFASHRETSSSSTHFQEMVINLLTQRFLLTLHHPFALQARSYPQFYYSRKEALEVAVSLVAPMATSSDSQCIESNDYTRLVIRGAGMFRHIPMQAISTICGESISQVEEARSSFKRLSSPIPVAEMHKAIKKYIEVASARIKYGETNVKGYVLFSCILAQIDALQSGLPVEPAIAAVLWQSMEHCYRLLEKSAMEHPRYSLQDSATTTLPAATTTLVPATSSRALLAATNASTSFIDFAAFADPITTFGPTLTPNLSDEWLMEPNTADMGIFYSFMDDM